MRKRLLSFGLLWVVLIAVSPVRAEVQVSARVDRKTRTIDVEIHGTFEVFLHDEMLDLDGPITIRRRGKVAWTGEVTRSLAFAIAHVKETGDRGRVFAASVKVD